MPAILEYLLFTYYEKNIQFIFKGGFISWLLLLKRYWLCDGEIKQGQYLLKIMNVMLSLSSSQLFYIMIIIEWTVRMVLCALKLVLFIICEWQVLIELLKTYSNMGKYPLKLPSHLKICHKNFKVKFGNVWASSTFFSSLFPNWWIGQNQLESFFLFLSKQIQVSYIS